MSATLRRRMLALAALAEQLAGPGDSAELGEKMLAALGEDVEALAVYLASEEGGFGLLLHAGFPQAPAARVASAGELAGAGGAELVALPVGGGEEPARGLVLFALKTDGSEPSLAALLEASAEKIVRSLMRDPGEGAEPGRPAAGKIRVLLIDDEPLLVALAKRILERAGFAFYAAHSARDGYELASSILPDVILMDKVMPDLDGTKLLRMMRRDELLSTVPVIMVSGQADEAARIAALGEGADDFVVKPFSGKDLVARIEANVRLVRLRRDAVWREGELLRLRQSQRELRILLDTVQKVRDDDRRMLAREVHDQLGQILTAAKIDIRLLQDRLDSPDRPPSTAEIAAELGAALSGVDLAIAAVQDISALLRPPELEEGGLVAALNWQAADLQRRTGMACVVQFDPDGYIEQAPFVAGELLRMCQEALTNVLRHAGATRVLIQVRMRNACLLVRICDDGEGIPRARLHDPASFGLKGMSERAASIRASIHVYGRRGRGTMVAIRRRLAFR